MYSLLKASDPYSLLQEAFAKANGFVLHTNHMLNKDYVWDIIIEHNPKVIFLERLNHLQRLVSMRIATETKKYVIFAEEEKPDITLMVSEKEIKDWIVTSEKHIVRSNTLKDFIEPKEKPKIKMI